MNIELPTTSRKEFFLYIYFPGGYNQELNVTLLTGVQVLKKVALTVNCMSSEDMIFGVLADNPSAFNILNDVKPLKGFVHVSQLKTSQLPDRAQAWAALDALIVSNTDTGTLTPDQTQALESWIAGGGKLLITGGIHWQSTLAGLKDLAPVDLTTTRHTSSLAQLQAYIQDQTPLDAQVILAQGKLRAGSQVLVHQDGIPVLVEKPMGFGKVYFFAGDPTLQPLSDWSGMKEVYQHLLGSRSQPPAWVGGVWYDYRANQALATIPELGLPSILYVCGLLGFYIAVIGPLNYFVLRRIKRRELAWVTIPVLVVVFTCIAYGTGFSYRGITPILNRLAVVQAWDGMEQAQVRGLVGLYSPIRTKYDLEAGDRFMFQPFQDSDMNLQAGNDWTSLQQGSSMVMPDVPVEIGAMRTVVMKGSLPALKISHDLVIRISKLNPVLTGSITNQSQYTLRDAILVTSGNWTRLGTIAPGETRPATVSLAAGNNGPVFYGLNAMNILDLDYSDTQRDEKAARRSGLLESVLFGAYGTNQGNWGIYLMGWVEDELETPAGLKDKDFKAIDTMLYVHSLSPSIKTEPGELRLPTSLFVWESSTPTATPYYIPEIPTGGCILSFQPAVPVPYSRVKSIDLVLTSNAPFQDIVVSLWDYEFRTWVRTPLTGNYTTIREPDPYVGPNGEIRMKIASNRSDRVEIGASSISLVVEP